MNTKIFLELCCNHNGDIQQAKKMIQEAANLKVFGIKLQKRDLDSIPLNKRNQPRNPSNSFGLTFYEHRKALEFSIQQIVELKDFTENLGLEFSCSAFDLVSAQQLLDIKCKWIKLPSQLLLDESLYRLLHNQSVAKIAISTGMHDYDEIIKSKWYSSADIRYYCISEYPAQNINLSCIKILPNINGYSSHELNGYAIPYAVCLGVELIERHFTLDKNRKGSDHKLSSDPIEINRIISEINMVENILGSPNRILSDIELTNRKEYRGF